MRVGDGLVFRFTFRNRFGRRVGDLPGRYLDGCDWIPPGNRDPGFLQSALHKSRGRRVSPLRLNSRPADPGASFP